MCQESLLTRLNHPFRETASQERHRDENGAVRARAAQNTIFTKSFR